VLNLVWLCLPSRPLHKAIHHALFARLVEVDRQLIAVHRGDVAVAEFQVEDARRLTLKLPRYNFLK
jgi:hypothetical protein